MYREAADHFFEALDSFGTPEFTTPIIASMRQAFAKTGIKGLWRAHIDELTRRKHTDLNREARYYAQLGLPDRALSCLREDGFHAVFAKVEPAYDALRPDPRFHELLNQLGLAD